MFGHNNSMLAWTDPFHPSNFECGQILAPGAVNSFYKLHPGKFHVKYLIGNSEMLYTMNILDDNYFLKSWSNSAGHSLMPSHSEYGLECSAININEDNIGDISTSVHKASC